MNAYELAEKLRQRKQELAATDDWVVFVPNNRTKIPSVRLSYNSMYINNGAQKALGLKPGMRIKVAYSPSQKVISVSKSSTEDGYSFSAGKSIPMRPIYSAFGLNNTPLRDTPDGKYPHRPALLIGDSLVIDVSDLVPSTP